MATQQRCAKQAAFFVAFGISQKVFIVSPYSSGFEGGHVHLLLRSVRLLLGLATGPRTAPNLFYES
jgi:hypothetical protein